MYRLVLSICLSTSNDYVWIPLIPKVDPDIAILNRITHLLLTCQVFAERYTEKPKPNPS